MELLTADQVTLGFIGLGNMGGRIARRLLDHGYQLSVYDRDVTKVEGFAQRGALIAGNVLQLAAKADVVLSCLTNDEAVQSVYDGPEGVFAGARPEAVVIEIRVNSRDGTIPFWRRSCRSISVSSV